jgi:signal transduction histidine kinase
VINHLSHELKTPVAVLGASLNILRKRLETVPESRWLPTMKRAKRNLERLLQLQYEVEDIMEAKHYDAHHLISTLLEECIDVLESLVVEETGEGFGIEKLRKRINALFLPKQDDPENILLDRFVPEVIESIKLKFGHRNIEIMTHHEPVPPVFLPVSVLGKIVDGLVKNAIENTPDGGKIEVNVQRVGESVELVVLDYGVGIMGDDQHRIFEGFWMTQDTMDYSSKREFDFNAGGKGADLLRMKIFSERYHFKIDMVSTRCRWLIDEKAICPGDIGKCRHCKTRDDCSHSGSTIFTVVFPAVQEKGGQHDNG